MKKFVKVQRFETKNAFGCWMVPDGYGFRPAIGNWYYESRSGLTVKLSHVEEGAIPFFREDAIPKQEILPDLFGVFGKKEHGTTVQYASRDQVTTKQDWEVLLGAWRKFRQEGGVPPSEERFLDKVARRATWGVHHPTSNIFYATDREVQGRAEIMLDGEYTDGSGTFSKAVLGGMEASKNDNAWSVFHHDWVEEIEEGRWRVLKTALKEGENPNGDFDTWYANVHVDGLTWSVHMDGETVISGKAGYDEMLEAWKSFLEVTEE